MVGGSQPKKKNAQSAKHKVREEAAASRNVTTQPALPDVGTVQRFDNSVITFEQSIEANKVAIHIYVGSVLFQRGLVSGGRFEWIPHTKNLPIACYDAFKGLESVERTQIKQTPGQLLPLPRMASGKLPVLDQILTLMESGVYAALERNFLKSLVIAIKPKDGDETSVYETYFYTLTSQGDQMMAFRQPNGHFQIMEPRPSKPQTLSTLRKQYATFSRRFNLQTDFCNPLPGDCELSLYLEFTELRDKEAPNWQPPGFVADDTIEINFPTELDVADVDFGPVMDTGYHRPRAHARILVPNDDEDADDMINGVLPRLPHDLTHERSQRLLKGPETNQPASLQDSDSTSSQQRRDAEIAKGFQSFIQQPPVADMEPTQQAMSTQQAREEPPTEGMQRSMNEIPGPTSNIKLQYLSVPTFHPDQQEKSQGNCSCGSVVTHGDKLICSACGSEQHSICYGFESANSPQIPDDFLCYSCLIGSHDRKTLERLKNIMPKRRALALYEVEDVVSDDKLASALGIAKKSARNIRDGLVKKGILVAKAESKAVFRKCTTDAARQNAAHYLDPLEFLKGYMTATANSVTAHVAAHRPGQLTAHRARIIPDSQPISPSNRATLLPRKRQLDDDASDVTAQPASPKHRRPSKNKHRLAACVARGDRLDSE